MKSPLAPLLGALLSLMTLSLMTSAAPARAAVVDRVAAVVNDDIITLSEVYELGSTYIEEKAGQGQRRAAELEVLDTLIQRRLISQEIERLGIDVTDVDVDRAIDDIARRNNLDRDSLRTEVEKSGMSWTQYRAELRESLRQQQFTSYITQTRISVNEDELKDAWRRSVAEQPQVQEVALGAFVLLFPAGIDPAGHQAIIDQAQADADRVRAGEDFATVAAQVDQGSFGAQGGHMGTYKQGELVGALDAPAFSTPVGEPSAPVVTDRGVFVLFPFTRRDIPPPGFDEMRPELEQKVYADRIDDEVEQWTQQARHQAAISVKLEAAP